jgi:hypothetical protein
MNRQFETKWEDEEPIGKPKRKKDRVKKKKPKFFKKQSDLTENEDSSPKKLAKTSRDDHEEGEWDSDDDLLFEWRRKRFVSDNTITHEDEEYYEQTLETEDQAETDPGE